MCAVISYTISKVVLLAHQPWPEAD